MIRWRRSLALLLAALLLVGPVAPVMATNCSVYKTFGSSEILTASDLNNSFTQSAVTNVTPQCADDYSATVAQMRTTTDPYPAGSESLATSTAGEFERLRYVIAQITGRSYWYQDPDPLTPPGDINLGVASTRSGILRFFHSGSAFRTSIQAGSATGDGEYVWPTALPSANRVLQSTSAGVLSWVAGGSFTGLSSLERVRNATIDTVNNTTTVADATELSFSLGASERVYVLSVIFYESNSTSDIKMGWTVPAGATGGWITLGQDGANTANNDLVTLTEVQPFGGLAPVGTDTAAVWMGIVAGGGTSGTVQLQFAQNSAVAEDTSIQPNSYILIFRE